MPGSPSRLKVAKLREARKAEGLYETNVWLTREVREAIGAAISAGKFRTQSAAILYALQATFGDRNVT